MDEFEKHFRKKPDDSVLQRLADISAIKPEEREDFFMGMRICFALAVHAWRFDQDNPARHEIASNLKDISEAAVNLARKLDGLDEKTPKALSLSALRFLNFGDAKTQDEHTLQVRDLHEVTDAKTRLDPAYSELRCHVELIQKAASSYKFRASEKGGARSKSPSLAGNSRASAEDLFIFEAFRITYKLGGRLTIDKTAKAGTLVNFLDEARQILPEGLIKREPSLSRMQSLRAEATGKKVPKFG